MALSIISNQAASIATRQLGQANDAATGTAEKLSSGKRVNSAADDAAASAIAARLSAEVSGLQQAGVNAGQASSLLQIGDGAFSNTEDILTRMKSLAVQAGSDQISDTERSFLNQEFQSLKTEIDRIADDTEFNGTKLVNQEREFGNAITNASTNTTTIGGIATADGGMGSITLTSGELSNDFNNATFLRSAIQDVQLGGVVLENDTNKVTTMGAEVFGGIQLANVAVNANTSMNAFTMLEVMLTVDTNTAGGEMTNTGVMFTGSLLDDNGIPIAGVMTDGSGNSIQVTNTVNLMLAPSAGANGTNSVSLTIGTFGSMGLSAGTTSGEFLVNGKASQDFTFKVGTGTTAAEDEISVEIGAITSRALGIANSDISSKDNADDASDAMSAAIDTLQTKRSEVGAAQNRLDFAQENLALSQENQEAARSELSDLNVAKAITEFSQQQLLVQAGTSTLSQANNLPQNLLQLFN
jgi:flagellin